MRLVLTIAAGIVLGGLLLLAIQKHFKDPLDPPHRALFTTPAPTP